MNVRAAGALAVLLAASFSQNAFAQSYPAYPSGPQYAPRETYQPGPTRVTPDYDDEDQPGYRVDPRPAYGERGFDPRYGSAQPGYDQRYGGVPDQRYGGVPDQRYGTQPDPRYTATAPAEPRNGYYGSGQPESQSGYGSGRADPRYGAAPAAPGVEQRSLRPPGDVSPQQAVPQQGMPQQGGAGIAGLPPEDQPETGEAQLDPRFRRQLVDFQTKEPAGTIVIDTANTYLYVVRGSGKAMRYGIGVGREGFTWAGTERVSRMAEWPDWHPPEEMIQRQPYLPRFMAGGPGNPLGARALYLGKTLYRIHGTNQPSTIGTFVSSGCIRLINEDIEDLYQRVNVGTRVVVLPGGKPHAPQTQVQQSPQQSPARQADRSR
ncbi:MAG: L,D-transpeptidase family protein [Rhizobiales bacterium]|nr:L,D-transpeptidase family protein [Hyphomicrobiales bacterium]